MLETQVRLLGREDPWEKEMATHSSILAWRISRTEEPGSLHSIGLQRAGHNWISSTTRAFLFSKLFCYIYRNNACMLNHSAISDSCNPMDCSPPGSSLHGVLSRQEYWSGLPFPPPEDLLDQGLNPGLQCLLHWQVGSLPQCHLKRLTEIICWVK